VVEGWHGQPYGKPLGRTREYVSIVRQIIDRTEPLTHDGEHYRIPYTGPDATGLGKPLTLITHPSHEIPIYLASLGPRNVALTAEIADGWLPVFFSPDRASDVIAPLLREGFAASGDPGKAERFDIAAAVTAAVVEPGGDIDAARRRMKPLLALYIGGMGARGRNFYHDLACRYGYDQEANLIQDLYLEGKRKEATMAVPDRLVDDLNLVGTRDMIKDRLDAWRDAGVTTLVVSAPDRETLRTLADLI
jgi:F420-dependent oxidoreductase-like protein